MKISTTMRLSEDAKRLLAEIARKHGLNSTAANELVIREAAESRGISLPESEPKVKTNA